MTPLGIEILLHYCVSSAQFRDLDAPAVREAHEEFVRLGLLYPPGAFCRENPLGEADYRANRAALQVYVDALCAVPLPEQKWVIPETEPIRYGVLNGGVSFTRCSGNQHTWGTAILCRTCGMSKAALERSL